MPMPVRTICDFDAYVAKAGRDRASWVQVAPEFERAVLSPAFVLGEWPAELSYGFYNETRFSALRCYRLRDVRLTQDGVMIAGDVALATPRVNHPEYHVAAIVAGLEAGPDLPVRRVDGPLVMLCGPGMHIYGHWLIDILPRLYLLMACGHDLAGLRYAVATDLPAFCHAFLDLLGILPSQIELYDPRSEMLAPDEVLVPINLRYGSQIHPLMSDATRWLRTCLCPNGPGEQGRRLFVSRRRGEPSRTMENREAIETIAEEAGFEVVSPEQLSIPDQVRLFAGASEIAGEYGSGLHGSIYAPAGTVILALRGTSHHPGWIQSGLGQVFRQPTGYVLSPTPIGAIDQHFAVSEDAFRFGMRCAGLLSNGLRQW